MNMVFDATDDDGLAIKIGQDAAEVTMQFFAQRFVTQERTPVVG
jgi:hypothetical protein